MTICPEQSPESQDNPDARLPGYAGIADRRLMISSATLVDLGFTVVEADVLAAWGQVAGAMATVAAVVVAFWIALRDSRHRDAERRDSESAHARLLSAARAENPPALRISYTNFGAFPITSVRLTALYGRCGDIKTTTWHIDGTAAPYVLGAVAPGKTVTTPPITVTWPEEADPVAALYYPTIVFHDANGRWWERTAHEQPKRLLETPPLIARLPTAD
ncbi:hypothetical protein [Actinokineospora fastidiosa]|uniref:Uncharacterized protein n=1 Tax=Actinokineospora fastidiosa TaxID=1816 RepID=A0A918GK83_9PSEU|nr:hypothetical protein [Actinokineospora fastidiosa]GGS40847.1 hypothetical protein GCM10010171_39260 [Actinokineospora fastidiosa]